MGCVFCSIAEDRIILQNTDFIAILDAHPVTPGHLLILSRRHTENVFELTADEFRQLHDIIHLAKDYLEEEYKPDGYNIGTNTGAAAGQSIKHFHLHVIPRYKNGQRQNLLRKSVNKLREYYLN